MRVLRARLYQIADQKRKTELEQLTGDKKEIAFGSQIRSYVFAPYQLIKDHRTNVEIGNVDAVMDGEIDPFIEAYLFAAAEVGRRPGRPASRAARASRTARRAVSGNELVRRRHEKLARPPAGRGGPVRDALSRSRTGRARSTRAGTRRPRTSSAAAGPVSVAGRVMSLRHHGKACFAHVLDRTGRIQLYARADVLGDAYAGFTDLDVATSSA